MNDLRTLQEARHRADYDLSSRVVLEAARTADAQSARVCDFLSLHLTGAQGRAFFVLVVS